MSDGSSIELKGSGKAGGRRSVVCCSCTHRFDSTESLRVAVCPACGQRMGVGELVIEEDFQGTRLCTAGNVVVGADAAVAVELIAASGDVDVAGAVDAEIRSLGLVRVRSTASLRGVVMARTLMIDPGAQVEGARFEVFTPSVDLGDVLERRAAESPRVID